jgi:hypothetical protein
MWQTSGVKPWFFISRLLAIAAVVSLLAAPVVTPSGAEAMDGASMAEMSEMAEMASMSGAMPCCPHQTPAIPDCWKSCALAVLCMAKCFPGAPAESAFIPARFGVAVTKIPGNDLWRDLLPEPPPPRPPRT